MRTSDFIKLQEAFHLIDEAVIKSGYIGQLEGVVAYKDNGWYRVY